MMPLNLAKILIGVSRPAVSAYGRSAARKLGIMLATGLLASTAAIAVFGFLLWALWEYVRPLVGPVGAPLILAATVSGVAIIACLFASYALRPKLLPQYHSAPALNPELMIVEVERLVRKQKIPVLLSAILLGVFAGSQKR